MAALLRECPMQGITTVAQFVAELNRVVEATLSQQAYGRPKLVCHWTLDADRRLSCHWDIEPPEILLPSN
jgi:hypothetical protein